MSGTLGQRYVTPDQFEITSTGVPLAGGQLFFYVSGTSTPADTYADVNLTTPNSNPVIADANGRFGSIFLSPLVSYKVQLYTQATPDNPQGSQIWSFDPVGPGAGGATSNVAGIVGEVRMFAGIASQVPAGWYLCYGQAVSRTTYSALFTAIGTTWGVGDGSTTFNLPDFRGRAAFGKDDMGGTPANRLTAGVSGVGGTTLGATGGDQALQLHTHTVNDPTHTHTLTDPGHQHGLPSGGFGGSLGTPDNVDDNVNTAVTYNATTGITIAAAATGITIGNTGAGESQNVPPAAVVNVIIYAGA